MAVNYFERASRMKLRWSFTGKGMVPTEDLWDMSLENLDVIFGALQDEADSRPRRSLLKSSEEDTTLDLCLSIVKHIVKVRQVEAKLHEAATDRAARKAKLLSVLADKQDEDLRALDTNEIQE